MGFSSNIFIYAFLPLCVISYFFIKWLIKDKDFKVRNGILIFFSLFFYLFGSGRYILILISVVCISYFSGVLISKYKKHAKLISVLAILLNLGLLIFFKYFNFLYSSISSLANDHFHVSLAALPKVFLPIGISFYVFQSVSYIADVASGKVRVQKNFFKLLLYISFFPQLIAGPIVRYSDMEYEITKRSENIDSFYHGFCRFIIGLSEKVLIADVLGESVDKIYGAGFDQLTQLLAISAAVMYSLEILFDFSGYSNMAIGIAEMFGFNFKENFDRPYTSQNVTEFWRRWHMSLSGWLKDYVYIPLGGNRKGVLRTYLNLSIVFLICGIWHGANWTFLIWGIYHGILLIIERILKNKCKFQLKSVYGTAITFIFVTFGWIIFRSSNLKSFISFISTMLGITKPTGFLYYDYKYYVNNQVIVVAIFSLILSFLPTDRIKEFLKKHVILNSILMVVLLILCMIFMSGASFNAFIYFKF